MNNWLRRYELQGLAGLATRPGQGRKAILNAAEDLDKARIAVQAHRQRISVAKAELELELDKKFCNKTLKRFLKNIVADTNACGNA